MNIDINKYWFGFLTGILIIINIFSVGVILTYTLSLNWIYFFWSWLITMPMLTVIRHLKYRQEKKLKGD